MKKDDYDWKQFLSFSEKLYADTFWKDDPATKYRIILSRSYYAAFHCAQDFLQEYHLQNPDIHDSEHRCVIRNLKMMKRKTSDFQRACKKIGLNLDRLREKRAQADYRADWSFKDADAQNGILQSHKIISGIDALKEMLK